MLLREQQERGDGCSTGSEGGWQGDAKEKAGSQDGKGLGFYCKCNVKALGCVCVCACVRRGPVMLSFPSGELYCRSSVDFIGVGIGQRGSQGSG